MAKSKAKSAPAETTEAPAAAKGGKLKKLILLAGVPLFLGGAGYAGWVFGAPLLGFGGGDHAEAASGDGGHGTDDTRTAAIPPEIAAETSFTYSFALAELLARTCGSAPLPALKAASEAEAKTDGMLVNLSWIAANRRLESISQESCGRMVSEIDQAEAKAAALAAPAKGEAKASGGHH